jgi:hypothetical protein
MTEAPQGIPAEVSRTPELENTQREHAIASLAIDLLRKKNKMSSIRRRPPIKDPIRDLFIDEESDTVIPLEKLKKRLEDEPEKVPPGYRDAVNITEFYLGNERRHVPSHVRMVGNADWLHLQRGKSEADGPLMYVDSSISNVFSAGPTSFLSFNESAFIGRERPRPDVYIGNISLPDRLTDKTKALTIKGARNLILGGAVTGPGYVVNVEASEDMGIMDGCNIDKEHSGSLLVGRSVYQHGGTAFFSRGGVAGEWIGGAEQEQVVPQIQQAPEAATMLPDGELTNKTEEPSLEAWQIIINKHYGAFQVESTGTGSYRVPNDRIDGFYQDVLALGVSPNSISSEPGEDGFISVTIAPQQIRAEVSRIPEFENAGRNYIIATLAADLLRKRNKTYILGRRHPLKDRAKGLFIDEESNSAIPLDKLKKRFEDNPDQAPPGYEDAVNIVEYYQKNETAYVPSRVIVIDNAFMPNIPRAKSEMDSALLYIADDVTWHLFQESNLFLALNESVFPLPLGRKKARHDLYIGGINRPGKKGSKRDNIETKKALIITGARNLILGGAVTGPNYTVNLEASEDVGIMDGCNIDQEHSGSLQVGGNVHQYGGMVFFSQDQVTGEWIGEND